ncbi:MAG: hypothetical protein JXR76_31345 [Deltaproteobacteria bacterium]|nr:hypothetical protein [Deltaproteobacteria bacterium]
MPPPSVFVFSCILVLCLLASCGDNSGSHANTTDTSVYVDSSTQTGDTSSTNGDSAGISSTHSDAPQSTDGSDDTFLSDTESSTDYPPAIAACIQGMQSIGGICRWDSTRTDSIQNTCMTLTVLDEATIRSLFTCAASLPCITWENDTTSDAAMTQCLSDSSSITTAEALETICAYNTTCFLGENPLLTEDEYYSTCMLTTESALQDQLSVVIELLAGCVPATATCSDAEIADYDKCRAGY